MTDASECAISRATAAQDTQEDVPQRMYWTELRHTTGGKPKPVFPAPSWNLSSIPRIENGVLLMCLNIGVSPPDTSKPKQCATLEAWVDPYAQPPTKSLEMIGNSIVKQFQKLLPQVNNILCLMPDPDTLRNQLLENRRAAQTNRVLLYYNGHDVPRPSPQGEIWFFNDRCTEYLPVSMAHLESWLGSPAVLVLDCHNAETPLREYVAAAAARRAKEGHAATAFSLASTSSSGCGNTPTGGIGGPLFSGGTSPSVASSGSASSPLGGTNTGLDAATAAVGWDGDLGVVLFGACSAGEQLPLNPVYPADIFTACMTTPLRTALLWFCKHSALRRLDPGIVDAIPGSFGDRSSPLGELNWIFTTVTDTIAWTVLPRRMFQKYFRQDSRVATLFRNFLLADRVMRSLNCTPVSFPRLPRTHNHPLWESWDMAVEMCLMQHENIVRGGKYMPSTFFVEQLRAFEVWLEFGATADAETKPADQLPIVLQMLLGKYHRERVLFLLSRFLDLGPWAVLQALSVGVFPYIHKLLTSEDPELKQSLVFIWTKILAFDDSPQADFVKNRSYCFFIEVVSSSTPIPVNIQSHHTKECCPQQQVPQGEDVNSLLDIRAMAAFVLSVLISKQRAVREECLNNNFIQLCLSQIAASTPQQAFFRQWLVLCLAKLWDGLESAQWFDIQTVATAPLKALITDPCPEVRAAAVYAAGTLINPIQRTSTPNDARASKERDLAMVASIAMLDASPLVRREVVVLMSRLFSGHLQTCTPILKNSILAGDNRLYGGGHNETSSSAENSGLPHESAYSTLWRGLQLMRRDPQLEVSSVAHQLSSAISISVIGADIPLPNTPSTATAVPTKQKSINPPSTPKSRFSFAFSLGNSSSTSSSQVSSSVPVSTMRSSPAGHPQTSIPMSIAMPLNQAQTTATTPASSVNLGLFGRHNTGTTTTTASLAYSHSLSGSGSASGGSISAVAASPSSCFSPVSYMRTWQAADGTIQSPSGIMGMPTPTIGGNNASGYALADESLCSSMVVPSVLYQWCCEFWKSALLKPGTVDKTAPAYLKQEQQKRERALLCTQAKETWSVWARSTKDQFREISVLTDPDVQPTSLLFHPYENILLTAGTTDTLTVWDIVQAEKVKVFSNQNEIGTRINTLLLANEDDTAHLVTGSSDGIVRIWRDFSTKDTAPKLVTSWRAHPQLLSVENGSGLLLDWQASSGRLLAAGDATNFLLWDVATETAVQDIPTQSAFSVTSVTFNPFSPSLFAAGTGDYALALFDVREPPKLACVAALRSPQPNTKNPILKAGFSSATRLVSAALGQIRIWDVAKPTPLMSFPEDGLVAFDVHRRAPLMASGSSKQHIRVYNQSGELRLDMKYHTGLYGRRIAAVSTLALHPHRLLLAAGLSDASTCIFSFEYQKA